MATSYKQARADHEYLWSIGPAKDMTGGYVDQGDLAKLLRSPTKATARDCYVHQIEYWFSIGPDDASKVSDLLRSDPVVAEIAERHGCNGF
jgi:hypothetical protein